MIAVLALAGTASATHPGANGFIAYTVCTTSNCGIYSMDEAGSGRERISAADEEEHSPAFSPNGTRLAFVRFSGARQALMIRNLATGHVRKIFALKGEGLIQSLSWSRNGSRIAMMRTLGVNTDDPTYEVVVVTVDTGWARALTNGLEGGQLIPAFSPTTNEIAFGSGRHLQVMDLATDAVRTIGPRFFPGGVSWSPDGERILYSGRGGSTIDLYVAHADGTEHGLLRAIDNSDEFDASWSPDGTKILLTRFFAESWPFSQDVFLMNADGTGLTRLTDTEAWDSNARFQPIPV
jgi:TolB protein